MRRTSLALVVLGTLGLFSACARNDEPTDDAAARDRSFLPGRALYRTHCAACHGKDGRGAANLFPPLRGSEWATGNLEIPVRAVLHGVRGEIEVAGSRYLNHMSPLGHRLSDQEIADVLNYVRASWGNRADPIAVEQVARVRETHRDRKDPWSPAELAGLGRAGVRPDSGGAEPGPP